MAVTVPVEVAPMELADIDAIPDEATTQLAEQLTTRLQSRKPPIAASVATQPIARRSK